MRKAIESALTGTLGVFALMLLSPMASWAQGPQVTRFAANYILMDGAEAEATNASNTSPPAAVEIYDNTVQIPASINTLYVTVAATGETEDGAGLLLGCTIDGDKNPCNIHGPAHNGAPEGFVMLQRGEADSHTPDNGLGYSWCTPVSGKGLGKGKHEIKLWLASTGPSPSASACDLLAASTDKCDGTVAVEQVHVYIDGSKVQDSANACTDLDTGKE